MRGRRDGRSVVKSLTKPLEVRNSTWPAPGIRRRPARNRAALQMGRVIASFVKPYLRVSSSPGFLGVFGGGPAGNQLRGDQRALHIAPATAGGMFVRPFGSEFHRLDHALVVFDVRRLRAEVKKLAVVLRQVFRVACLVERIESAEFDRADLLPSHLRGGEQLLFFLLCSSERPAAFWRW